MQNDRIEYLLLHYYEGDATDSEKTELFEYLQKDEYKEQFNILINILIKEKPIEYKLADNVSEDILISIFQSTRDTEDKNNLFINTEINRLDKLKQWKYWLVAATFTGISILSLVFWPWSNPTELQTSELIQFNATSRKDKATLSLWDGTTLNLDSTMDGNIPNNLGIQVNSKQGELISDTNSNQLGFNTLRTAIGGQYKLVLPDGSRAWLNAGSSIRYPTAFLNKERIVTISGEIYFEIQPSQNKPFIVQLAEKKGDGNDMEVKVLGTHFNISSYSDEPTINTTLIEGAVEIKNGNVKKILLPGHQARVSQINHQKDILVQKVDTQGIIAWKEGRFEFNGNIQDIMRQISRWYGIQVKYENNAEAKSFTGIISRKNNITEVLKMLELTGEVQFSIENGTVHVKAINN